MKRWFSIKGRTSGWLMILLGLLILTGCQTSEEAVSIHMVFPSETDLTDIPSIMALDRLEAQGYEVKRTYFAGVDLAVEAVSRGDAQISVGAIPVHWRGIQNDANIVTIAEQVRNTWSLVSAVDIEECANIAGKRVALTDPNTGSAALTNAYIAQNCPDISYDLVLIAGSSNRAAALLAGEIDVTPLELVDAQRVQNLAPDQVYVLSQFADSLPDMVVTGIYANRTFAEKNPAVVDAYLRELLSIHTEIRENPDLLVQATAEILEEDVTVLPDIIDLHIDFNAWRVDGGLNTTRVQNSLDFYVGTGDLEPGLTVEDVANFDYLQAILTTQ